MTTIKPTGRVALRLSEQDAAAVVTIARKLAEGGSAFVTISDVLRHALQVAALGDDEKGFANIQTPGGLTREVPGA